MNKVISWAFAVALICGLNVFTSCKSDDSQVSPVESQERLELEAALSRSLNEASKDTRFDVGKDVLKNLTEIVANMNDEALKALRNEIIYTVLNEADLVFFEKLSEEEKAVVHKCLVERFDLTEEDLSLLVGFMVVDAYKVFGHMKVTFKDGQVVVGEGDDFTIENIDKDGGITIDDCVEVSRRMNDLLDAEPQIGGDEGYIFEVSSPGLGRVLKKDKHFEKAIGQDVDIKTYKPVNGAKEFTGMLKAFDKDTLTIEFEDGTEVFSRSDVAQVKLSIDF